MTTTTTDVRDFAAWSPPPPRAAASSDHPAFDPVAASAAPTFRGRRISTNIVAGGDARTPPPAAVTGIGPQVALDPPEALRTPAGHLLQRRLRQQAGERRHVLRAVVGR